MATCVVKRSRSFHPLRLRQLRLALVKRPELFRLEFQPASDVQSIQRSHAEVWPMLAGEIGAYLEGIFWEGHGKPSAAGKVLFHLRSHALGFRQRQFSAKYVLAQDVLPLGIMKRRKPQRRSR